MSTLRTPVGPQPPSVYWKRRAVVLLGLVAVIVIIVLIVAQPGGSPAPAASPSATTTSEAPGDPTVLAECDPENIELVAKTDKDGYVDSDDPMVSMTITNTSTEDCTYDVGTDAQEYLITSGSDRIWSSKDCQTDAAPGVVTLAAGVPQETAPFPWDRTRSSTSTCDGKRPAVTANGASYFLTVKLGDIESAKKQFLLY
jgi:hypothetical protein